MSKENHSRKNNYKVIYVRLENLCKESGYADLKHFCTFNRLPYVFVKGCVTGSKSIFNNSGDLSNLMKNICFILDCNVKDFILLNNQQIITLSLSNIKSNDDYEYAIESYYTDISHAKNKYSQQEYINSFIDGKYSNKKSIVLNNREKEVLLQYFGIGDIDCQLTLACLAKKYNIRKEMVQNIISKSIRKLRNSHQSIINDKA